MTMSALSLEQNAYYIEIHLQDKKILQFKIQNAIGFYSPILGSDEFHEIFSEDEL